MDNPEKSAKKNKNTTQDVFDTTIRKKHKQQSFVVNYMFLLLEQRYFVLH